MLARLKQMLIKEFIQVFRDGRTRWVLFGPPLIQMMIFGYAATFEIKHVAIAILDLDHSQESRDLVSRFGASPYFALRPALENRQELADKVERGETTLAMQIPPGFAQKLQSGETASAQLIVDGTNSNTALIAAGYANQVALAFAGDYQRERMQARAPFLMEIAPSVELDQRPWYNTDLRSRWFFVPGIIGNIAMLVAVILTAFAIVREREIGTLEQIMVTPIRPVEFILGKTVPFFLIGLFDLALLTTVGILWFRIPLRGSFLVLLLGTVLYLLCMLGVGLFISTVSATQQQAMVTSFFFTMPAIMFSGFSFPISTMPHWLQYLTYLSPLRYFLVVLRGVFLKGVGLNLLWPQMAGMAILGTFMLTISVFRFHKALD